MVVREPLSEFSARLKVTPNSYEVLSIFIANQFICFCSYASCYCFPGVKSVAADVETKKVVVLTEDTVVDEVMIGKQRC